MRLIDADRLLEERRMHTYYHLQNGDTAVPIIDIQNAPTIEPERKTGEWSINYHSEIYRYKCSVCKAVHRARYDFCPSCGAKMKG